ncbi:MAG: hypothetical protein HYU80_04455 [Candidatus Blackburnbacteria bacterium]|nr:hypothetical protein [Candidatus Blackburnbacteria bacterium]
MLTKNDFDQIRGIIREEVENEVQASRDSLDSTIREARVRIQTDVRDQADRIKNLEIRITGNHKELKKEIRQVADFLDKENLKTQKRVSRIEDHLDLPLMPSGSTS